MITQRRIQRIFVTPVMVSFLAISGHIFGAENSKNATDLRPKNEDSLTAMHFLSVDAVINAYKPIAGIPEGEVRPRVLAAVLNVPDIEAQQMPRFAREKGLPYIEGSRLVYLYSTRGISVTLVRRGTTVKDNDVVEVALPSAREFRNFKDRNKVKEDLDDLSLKGVYGVVRLRRDCVASNVGKKDFSIYCNGSIAHPVANKDQLSAATMYWLTAPAHKLKK